MNMRPRILAKKSQPAPGVCILIENGVACPRPIASRGLCQLHRSYLESSGQLEKHALPRRSRKSDLRPNPCPKDGVCAVMENGVPCAALSGRRGLCNRHYQAVWQRPDLRIEDFARSPQSITYSRTKRPVPGQCVVRELDPGKGHYRCTEAIHARDLCRRHYKLLSQTPELFAKIAKPLPVESALRLKNNLTDGICVIVENNIGCTAVTAGKRRVCLSHQRKLAKAGKLNELTDRFLTASHVLEKKPPAAIVPGFCVMTVNGISCTNAPRRRGLCNSCIWLIGKQGLEFEQFALPAMKDKPALLARKERIFKGICILCEDGIPCPRRPLVRGLCKIHYKLAGRQGLRETLALSAAEVQALPEIPHFYFDKNVIIRFALTEIFATAPDRYSVLLVQSVLQRRIRATVSLDCIRALYSHIGHRLARPQDLGGKGMDEAEAERKAREYAGKLFFGRDGLWSFLPFSEEAVRRCTLQKELPNLSLEDALEVNLYAHARNEHGAQLFVTADGGILQYGEAVHPEKVVRAYGLDQQAR